jgi:hypothetical protein
VGWSAAARHRIDRRVRSLYRASSGRARSNGQLASGPKGQGCGAPPSAHKSVTALTADLDRWIEAWNDDPRPFVWHKTADQILGGLKKYLTNL